jgi:hypothetical protein
MLHIKDYQERIDWVTMSDVGEKRMKQKNKGLSKFLEFS